MTPTSEQEKQHESTHTEQVSESELAQAKKTADKAEISAIDKKHEEEDQSKATTADLLAELDKDVVSDTYSADTKKAMLVLRDDIKEGKMNQQQARTQIDELKKQGKETSTDSDDDLTLWQKTKKWALTTLLPFGIGTTLAKKLIHKNTQKEKEDGEKKSWWKTALKRTGVAAAGLWIASKRHKVSAWFASLEKKQDSQQEKNADKNIAQMTTTTETHTDATQSDAVDADVQNKSENASVDANALDNTEDPTVLANAEAEAAKLHGDGFDQLYILMRLYQQGCIPPKAFGIRPIDKVMDGQRQMATWLRKKLLPGVREKLLLQKAEMIKTMPEADYNARLALLAEIDNKIAKGDITSMKQLHQQYGDVIENKFRRTEKFASDKNKLAKVRKNMEDEVTTKAAYEQDIIQTEKKLHDLQDNAKKQLESLQKQAESVKDPTQKKKLLGDIQKTVDAYNAEAIKYQSIAAQKMSFMSDADLLRIEQRSPIVKNILQTSGGVGKFIEKANSKGGKFMLGLAVWSLASQGVSDIKSAGIISKETALDVVDLGAGMVPFAGGVYDMQSAFRGKDLNGRDLSTTDRWIRGTVGGLSLVLDVAGLFTFGAGNAASAALKGGVKGATETVKVIKTIDKTVDAVREVDKTVDVISGGAKTLQTITKGARLGINVITFGSLGYGVYAGIKEVAVPLMDAGSMIKTEAEVKMTSGVTI